jgi:hypothetical protein
MNFQWRKDLYQKRYWQICKKEKREGRRKERKYFCVLKMKTVKPGDVA